MVGGGALGAVIGTVHITTIVDGHIIDPVCQPSTGMYIQGGEDITAVTVGTAARGTIE